MVGGPSGAPRQEVAPSPTRPRDMDPSGLAAGVPGPTTGLLTQLLEDVFSAPLPAVLRRDLVFSAVPLALVPQQAVPSVTATEACQRCHKGCCSRQ